MPAVTASIPNIRRNWLRCLRGWKAISVLDLSHECRVSHSTIHAMELGSNHLQKITIKTAYKMLNYYNAKADLMYLPTDELGRLTSKMAITDIMTLFAMHGAKAYVQSEDVLREIFAPNIADYLIESLEV